MATALALGALLVILAVAVARPWNVPEAAVAVPLALLLVVMRVLPAGDAWDEVGSLAPVVGGSETKTGALVGR